MRVRELLQKDAPLMLEWMHDADVVRNLRTDFAGKTISDCERFIEASAKNQDRDLHMAVTDDSDIYMGTVSLKGIDRAAGYAEFAITVRKCAMGQGYSAYGMREILRIGHRELGLKRIIWCVSEQNVRANRFYVKNGYQRCYEVPQKLLDAYADSADMIWYMSVE